MIRIFLLFFVISLAFLENSYARKSKIYVGIDGFNAGFSHQFKDSGPIFVGGGIDRQALTPFREDASSSDIGFGASIGHIGYFREFFVAPELFYDHFNSSTPDFFAPEDGRNSGIPGVYAQDELAINYRYGARLNLGFGLFRHRVGIFGNIGFAAVDYDMRWKGSTSPNLTFGGTEVTPIYGGGVHLNLSRNLILKLAHDFQRIDARYVIQGFISQVDINVTRVGVMFAF